MAKRKAKTHGLTRSGTPGSANPLPNPTEPRLYTLEAFLIQGPITKQFAKKHPIVSRTIQMRGDQTLEDLHHALFKAYGRWEEHFYEFQFGKGPMDPDGQSYVLPQAFEIGVKNEKPPAGRVDQTTLDSLGLSVGGSFGYWFDFGDDWWHQINVEAIKVGVPKGKYPKITKRVGQNPPQYAEQEDDDDEEDDGEE